MSPPRPSWSATGGSSSTATAGCTGGCSPVATSIPGESPAEAAIRESVEETGLAWPIRRPDRPWSMSTSTGRPRIMSIWTFAICWWAPDQRSGTRPGGEPGRGLVHLGGGQVADDALAGALRSARRLIGSSPASGWRRTRVGAQAMAEPFDTLMEVQEHDTTLDQLRHRVDTLPERAELRECSTAPAALEAALAEVQAQVDDLAARQRQLEERIAASADRRHEIEQRMRTGEVTASRDLQAMDPEVHQLSSRQEHFEEEEMALLEEEEPLDALLAEHRTASEALAAEAAPARGRRRRGRGRHRGGQSPPRRNCGPSAARPCPRDLAERYEALRSRMGGVGAARLVGDRCDGCHLTLPSVEVERIRAPAARRVRHLRPVRPHPGALSDA